MLQSAIKASSQKNKKEKKKEKKGGAAKWNDVSFADGPAPGEGSDGEAAAAKGDISAPKAGVQMTADELADEEWGPVKGKKGKKGNEAEAEAEARILQFSELGADHEGITRFLK